MAKPNVLIRSKKNKAIELLNNNKLREADALFAAVCQAAPTDVESWVMRGLIHRKLGQFSDSETCCHRALQYRPDYAWGYHVMGSALQCQGRMDESLACYRKAIGLAPNYAESHYFLANALREVGGMGEAVASYRQAIKLQPNYVEALCNLGAVLTALGEVQEAAGLLKKALSLRPDAPQIHCNLGQILEREGRFAEALEKYQRAMELDPESLDVQVNVASLLEKTNRLEEAAELVSSMLPHVPDDPALLLVAARLARRENKADEAIALLEGALEKNPGLGVVGDIHFLLGQMYDKAGDPERAYFHFIEGNRLVAQVAGSYGDQTKFLDRVDKMHAYLVSDLCSLQPAQPIATNTADPVFLLGFQRSGTTLLEQILDSHPGLQSMEEKPTVFALVGAFEEMAQGRESALAELSDDQVSRLREVYFNEVARHVKLQPGSLLVDKMPLNTINAHVIWRVFPQAKFILAIRHPCDVCLSCFMQNFVMNESNAGFISLDNAARVYSEVMQLWQMATRLLPLDYHQIRYEDLVSDFEKETRALLEFLGVGWDDSVRGHTEHAVKRGTIRTPSYHQVTRPIYQDAKYRWKRYAKQFEPVLPVLRPFIDYFGYRE
ncbi:MAG: hypothetical protein BGP20_00475 [Thiobacillus sp. 63-78]|uniref:tetratricopeptide repeat-containing sulfotransferase family protein n=1 Tax=Thiobacillus sp. 63-78 TaxID=1895859 RepID=UPI000960B555|nr:tetratricopeptide repeat-containing sulfotransferase family protein [Thiobacillus sp. 63-78]MBN8764380.1 tetratricopeptide repeat protein [Thiobacillus sp.]OJZ09881.1 MAG: hypothetical protein BGP20_00475 [Thiobacillus sp. 63-78]